MLKTGSVAALIAADSVAGALETGSALAAAHLLMSYDVNVTKGQVFSPTVYCLMQQAYETGQAVPVTGGQVMLA